MSSLVQPAYVLLDPLDATGAAVEARHWVWPLVLLCLCVSSSGIAFALRWDASASVVRELQSSGRLERLSESEISEELQTASRKALVGGVAKGVFVMPLLTLLLAAVLWVCGWLFETPAPFGKLMAAAAVAMLPIALYHLIFTVCALAQHALTLERVPELVPSSLAVLDGLTPRLKRVLGAVDFFNLWSVGLLGLGFAAASGMRRGRALALSGALYLMSTGVFAVGLPGMGGGR
ncbi:MAG TPA: YIP1 family protein [Myxococcaceae bacterium]|nr:YIP1 family protein [Myxococcaceae bacterium]